MWEKKEDKKEESLLKELCGDDAKLYDFLSYYMYEHPLEAISKKDLDILTEEAERSGNFRPAVDKAIFEAAQKPGERERYITSKLSKTSRRRPYERWSKKKKK